MASVQHWAQKNGYTYQSLGDELFEFVDPELLDKTASQRVIATDLARLALIKARLSGDYQRVVWLDADFLIFAPESFVLPNPAELPEAYMVGREVWVQADALRPTKLKAYVKVHNAFLLFDRQNVFLDFYLAQAERLVRLCDGPMPPQFVGPKLLTALHNVIQCPVLETAGMFCPEVIRDLLGERQRCCALQLMRKRSPEAIAGANLCNSLAGGVEISDRQMTDLVARLLSERCVV